MDMGYQVIIGFVCAMAIIFLELLVKDKTVAIRLLTRVVLLAAAIAGCLLLVSVPAALTAAGLWMLMELVMWWTANDFFEGEGDHIDRTHQATWTLIDALNRQRR